MKYKLLAVLSLAGLTALAVTTWNRATAEGWNRYYRGTPTGISESNITENELVALTEASRSLRLGLKTLTLHMVRFSKLPNLTSLENLTTLEIGNKEPIEIDPAYLPSKLQTLALRNNINKFTKAGVNVVPY